MAVSTIVRMSITFGLVNIPVTVHAATEQRSTGLKQVHAKDGSRIRLRRYCDAEGVEVPYVEVVRGFEASDGRVVVLTDEDLSDLPLPTARAIEVLGFVPAETVDPVALDRAYFLGASGLEGRPYVLLREALAESGLVGIARMVLRTRESLAVLRVRDDVLCLQGLLWPDEVRPTTGLAPDAPAPRPQELRMARTLMDQLTEDFRWDEQHDEYREALERVVTAKLEGIEPPHAPAAQVLPGRVVDLMAMLQASVAVRETHGNSPSGPGQAAKKATPKSRRRSS
ncbi:Ku protein [Streptomyces sp. NBC_00280]|uniref:non-homologous end joining protein Ku n=1 Tax=Streptomyces sp. NBC_00280 TaxID=2975699 RepID=UPI002F9179D5